jgi:hypothetical protein
MSGTGRYLASLLRPKDDRGEALYELVETVQKLKKSSVARSSKSYVPWNETYFQKKFGLLALSCASTDLDAWYETVDEDTEIKVQVKQYPCLDMMSGSRF